MKNLDALSKRTRQLDEIARPIAALKRFQDRLGAASAFQKAIGRLFK